MMDELRELLNKGGEKVFSRYNVEIGDALWTALRCCGWFCATQKEVYTLRTITSGTSTKGAIPCVKVSSLPAVLALVSILQL